MYRTSRITEGVRKRFRGETFNGFIWNKSCRILLGVYVGSLMVMLLTFTENEKRRYFQSIPFYLSFIRNFLTSSRVRFKSSVIDGVGMGYDSLKVLLCHVGT